MDNMDPRQPTERPAGLILLNDLLFEKQYFHSATLRVIPIRDEPVVNLVIQLFKYGGMQEFAIYNKETQLTVTQFYTLIELMGGPVVSDDQKIAMYEQKMHEVSLVRAALEKKKSAEPAKPPSTSRPSAPQRMNASEPHGE